jgi:hypothetical protein
MDIVSALESIGACSDAVGWHRSKHDARKEWLVGKYSGPPLSEPRKRLALCCCDCAAIVLPFTKDKRVGARIERVRRWARGERGGTIRSTVRDDYAASYAAYTANAASAAEAATCANNAAAAVVADGVVSVYYDAAVDNAFTFARETTLQRCGGSVDAP